ncbi:MAG: hypothetical protein K0R17_2683 [Rariglobus sp.]|jgi:hypothetical protein|nr:hypothetical protein [Rariglobus sp.]
MKKLTRFALVLAAAALAQTASAVTLVQYSFTGADTAARLAPTTTGSGLTASNFLFGAGVTASAFSGVNGNPAPSAFATSAFITEAISATSTDYFAFNVTANAGSVLNLQSISFSYTYNNNGSVAVVDESANFSLRSSVDNYATSITSFTKAAILGQNNGWTQTGSISLTSGLFQNLDGVQFRLFVEDNSGSSAYAVRVDNFVLSGEVAAIPEPSTYAVLAGGVALGLVVFRRRLIRS